MSLRPRILIAEDDSLMRDLIRARLNGAGYDTHTARTGREAIDRTIVVRPHALLLDINLPDVDGFGVLEAFRNDLPDIVIPTLMLTSRRSSDDVRRAISLGASDYLTKDAIESQLLPRLARTLRTATAATEQQRAA
jgi:DNA-binding response OmpR family regulator